MNKQKKRKCSLPADPCRQCTKARGRAMTSVSPDSFGSDSRSKFCKQDALPDHRSRLLISTRLSTTRVAPFVIEQPFLAP